MYFRCYFSEYSFLNEISLRSKWKNYFRSADSDKGLKSTKLSKQYNFEKKIEFKHPVLFDPYLSMSKTTDFSLNVSFISSIK